MPGLRTTLVLCVAALAACASTPAPTGPAAARLYLDPRTAATITMAGQPFVFAREHTALAVNARDYISLTAIDVNRAGRHALYWWGYTWSTIDRRGDPGEAAAASDWVLVADGRQIALRATTQPPIELGISRPPSPLPVRDARQLLFVADAEDLEYLGSAAQLSLQSTDGSSVFPLWKGAGNELKALLERLGR
jgi:hypothetical protein